MKLFENRQNPTRQYFVNVGEKEDGVYYLMPECNEGAITFITGKNNFLVDCGPSERVVTEELSVGLRKIGYSFKDIDYVVFTHCHPASVGGAHMVKKLAPNAHFLAFKNQVDKLRNPMFHLAKTYENFADYAPPIREVSGVYVDGIIKSDNVIFDELRPVITPGHDDDCVCWYHKNKKFLVAGDAVQGNGSEETGIAFYKSIYDYRESLNKLMELEIENLLPGKKFEGIDGIISSAAKCREVIKYSYDRTDFYDDYVKNYEEANKDKEKNMNMPALAAYYLENVRTKGKNMGKRKQIPLGYAMVTLSNSCNRISK